MPLTRQQKQERMDDYLAHIERSQAVLLTDYRGLGVTQLQGLRRQLRQRDAAYAVVKNTLFRMALQERGITLPEEATYGTMGVAFAFSDPVGAAQALSDFARETKIFQIRGAVLGQKYVDAAGVEALSKLPSREVLLAQVVGAFQAPIAGLVNVMAGPIRALANVLNARAEQMREAA